jgi:hypothetical protein
MAKTLALVSALGLLGLAACQSNESGALLGGDETSEVQLPKIKVNLPPPPSFEKPHAPETYPDGSRSIYGLRHNMRSTRNKQVRVKAFLIDVYTCPKCPRGTKKSRCPRCERPHLWLSDRASGSRDKGLLVTGYPKRDPRTRRKIKFTTGLQYYFSGVFSRRSGTGFSASDGLLIYIDHSVVSSD